MSLCNTLTARVSINTPALHNEYLLRGEFSQVALAESLTVAHRMLREDIIDKVLKRDMTALFGARRVVELEQVNRHISSTAPSLRLREGSAARTV
jgi:hypothetical protein